MWLSCDDIHIRIGTFTYRYCWEITSERTMYNMQNVLGNFTELQTLSSNNSNGVVQRCLIKGNEQLFATRFSNSNILGCDERIEPLIEHHLPLKCIVRVRRLKEIYLTVCLHLYRAFIFSFFLFFFSRKETFPFHYR